MNHFRIFWVAGLFGVLLISSCSRPTEQKAEVIVLHSGRLRGNVYPLSLQGISPLQHYQYLAGYVKKAREEAAQTGAKVVLVDLGDSLSGSFAAHVTDSVNVVTFFNDLGFDAVMLSNLDGEIPEKSLAQLKAKILNPFVGPDGQPATPGTSGGARCEIQGLPVYLLANFYGDTSQADKPGRFPTRFGNVSEGVAPLRDYAPVLKALGVRPPGSLTLFAWMKFEPSGQPPEGFLKQLREDRVDAILAHRIYGGQEREAWQSPGLPGWVPPVSLNILRNNAGFALSRMDLAKDGDGWKVLKNELVPMTANVASADPAVVASIEKFAGQIREADIKIADLAAPMNQARILEIYMQALTAVPGTGAVAYSPESIRSDWAAGELRASAVFNALPWTSSVVQIPVDRAQLQKLTALAGLRVLVPPEEAGGPILLTTSRFFAGLIARELQIPTASIVSGSNQSEFDFFVESLKANPALLTEAGQWKEIQP